MRATRQLRERRKWKHVPRYVTDVRLGRGPIDVFVGWEKVRR